MNNLVQVILLGIIEGVTEFLPISSTGHLLIAEKLGLGVRSEVFNIVIQAGAILAVTYIFWDRIAGLLTGFRDPARRDYALKLAASFGITSVLGLVVAKLGFELPETIRPVAWALVLGGVWIYVAEWIAGQKQRESFVTWRVAVIVGVAQIAAAVLPGLSRSGATIFAAMLTGTSDRKAATEFAFLVGIPTMYAASGYALLKDLKREGASESMVDVGVGFAVSTAVAFVVVKWLLRYIQAHRFTGFALYRILLGLVLLLALPSDA